MQIVFIFDYCIAYYMYACDVCIWPALAWFLEIAFVQEVNMHVCLCVSAPWATKNHLCEMKPE